jgi:hypothetical protein
MTNSKDDPFIANKFALRFTREHGAATSWLRCTWVDAEKGRWHRCILAVGHSGNHVFGKQELDLCASEVLFSA